VCVCVCVPQKKEIHTGLERQKTNIKIENVPIDLCQVTSLIVNDKCLNIYWLIKAREREREREREIHADCRPEIFRQRPGWPYQLCMNSMLLHKYFVQQACEHGQTSFSFCHVRLLGTGGVTMSGSTWLGE